MKKIVFQLFIVIFLGITAKGQDVSGRLSYLFSLLDSAKADSRIRINDSIRFYIDRFASSDSAFKFNFSGLRFLGQVTSRDKNIKIINWNLIMPDNTMHYFCYVIRRGDKENKNSVYRLTGINTDGPLRTDTTYTKENWYGALYYDISPVKFKKETFYVLLGIDIGSNFINRKMIDVLSFRPDGEPVFGRKWFDTGKKIQYRVIFEYDATGVMSLKFSSPDKIVFDRLAPLYRGDRERLTFGADYTLDSYVFKNGIWKFIPNVDARNKE